LPTLPVVGKARLVKDEVVAVAQLTARNPNGEQAAQQTVGEVFHFRGAQLAEVAAHRRLRRHPPHRQALALAQLLHEIQGVGGPVE
jgi:hypothetical protein